VGHVIYFSLPINSSRDNLIVPDSEIRRVTID
jgi:hypothetical protein